VHPPKVSRFDVPRGIAVDNKGFERIVDEYRVAPFGLYVSREIVGRPSARWIESWLLPELGLCVTDWWWNPGHERDQDYYLDVCTVVRDGDRWTMTDHYLDILVRSGCDARVIDVDEFVAAVADRFIDAAIAQSAMHTAYAAVAGLAEHCYDLDAWLSGHRISLTWRPRPTQDAG